MGDSDFLKKNEKTLKEICENKNTCYIATLLIDELSGLYSNKNGFKYRELSIEEKSIFDSPKELENDLKTRLQYLIDNYIEPKNAEVIPLPKSNDVVTLGKFQAA